MTALRTPALRFALIMALLLPLQGLAALRCAYELPHCDHAAGASQHGECGSCCVPAAPVTPLLNVPSERAASRLFVPLSWPAPAVLLERLDRPPRFANLPVRLT